MKIMGIISKKVERLFIPAPIPKLTKEFDQYSFRQITSLLSNGSVPLQNGEYLTEDDMDIVRNRVYSCTFDGLS